MTLILETPTRVPQEIAAALVSYRLNEREALKQGWCLCEATDTGELFIDCDDHDPQRRFKDFQEALDFVTAEAGRGSELAQQALAIHRWYARAAIELTSRLMKSGDVA